MVEKTINNRLIAGFIFLLIGITLTPVLANLISENTELKTNPNDQIDHSAARDTNNDFDNTLAWRSYTWFAWFDSINECF